MTYALFWCGMRHFARKQLSPLFVIAGPLIWLAACQIESFHGSPVARLVLSSALLAAYGFTACWELYRLDDQLPSKLPLVFVLLLHVSFYALRIPLALARQPLEESIIHSPWVVVIATEALLFVVASSFLLVSLAKERSEGRERILASVDALTGVLNRRSFFESCARALERCKSQKAPATLLMIDVDHFKRVNDEFGHQRGDRILSSVAAALKGNLRAGDICGRLGGEEFACLLPNCPGNQVAEIAERVRRGVINGVNDHRTGTPVLHPIGTPLLS